MARRKRTPSDPASSDASQKRVAFEVPASLEHLSTISRALATSTDPGRQAASPGHSQPRQPQPGLTSSQSSSVAPASLLATNRVNPTKQIQFIVQNRPFPDAQPWPQPMPQTQSYNATSTHSARPTNQHYSRPLPSTSEVTPSAVAPANPQSFNASKPGSATSSTQEPALKPGETPSLTTHPNLIASLVARKRAENEARGFREIWAKRQAEYKMSKSAQSSPQNGLKAVESVAQQNPPDTASKSPSTRSAPMLSRASAPIKAVVDTAAATDNRVSAPATGDSKMDKGVPERRRTESDSSFSPTFPSPATGAPEKPANTVGLKGTSKSTSTSNKRYMNNPPVPQSHEHQRSLPTAPTSTQTNTSVEHAPIPPLFSDKGFRDQSQSQPQNHMSEVGQMDPTYKYSPDVTQQHAYPRIPISRQNSQSQLKAYGAQPQISSQPPVTASNPYYARSPSMSEYYKMDMQTQFYSSDQNSNTQSNSNGFDVAEVYGRSSTPMHMTYTGHLAQNPNAYMASMPPATGPLSSYGASMASPTEQPKLQSQSTNTMMTAADMVAGINTKFKVATQDGFAVPRRF
ncbi:hypothetical protein PV08_05012 [Exophiala spinifera]|uniref:Uncharacterized protein n=1 Tax=Exophiala spinifera TaxID=91928 RepID=A0A0D1ZYS3_9EURO|nr:uncharacterized protein PV08_05012 [Exophiala spinifera]KIW17817.1 hypothetical protein PV08_05012 [Exophiala spinifera]